MDLGVGHLVAEDFLVILSVMQDVHDLLHVSLRSCGVVHFEIVRGKVQPVFNLLLISVAFICDAEQALDSLIEIVPGIVNIDCCPSEQCILFCEELFAWCESFHCCIAYGDRVIIFEFWDLFFGHGFKNWLSVLDASLLGGEN